MNLQLFDNLLNHFKEEKNLIETNIYQDETSYTVEFYIAGIDKKGIVLSHEGNNLTIKLENHESPCLDIVKKEFSGYYPTRTISLTDADFTKCKTNYHNGKLVVNIGKKTTCNHANEILID